MDVNGRPGIGRWRGHDARFSPQSERADQVTDETMQWWRVGRCARRGEHMRVGIVLHRHGQTPSIVAVVHMRGHG